MSSPRITYTSRPDATSEGEVAVLANVYQFILSRGEDRRTQEMKSAPGVTSTKGDDAKKGFLKHEDRAFPDYTGT